MKRLSLLRRLPGAMLALVLLGAWPAAQAGNSDPVVLVHGFAGFGRTELLGYKYWGGFWERPGVSL